MILDGVHAGLEKLGLQPACGCFSQLDSRSNPVAPSSSPPQTLKSSATPAAIESSPRSMSFAYENGENELPIDACVVVYNHLYLLEKSVRHEIKQQQMEPSAPVDYLLQICNELFSQRCALHLVCRPILSYARRIVKTGYLDWKIGMEITTRAFRRHCSIEDRTPDDTDDEDEDVDDDEERPLKIQRSDDLPSSVFQELMGCMDACTLNDLHKRKLKTIMVHDPKRNITVPSRFCSFHLALNHVQKSQVPLATTELGPPYELPQEPLPSGTILTKYVAANKNYLLASYSTEVISIRVVNAGPDNTYPVEVYGKVIARDEIDYKCVYLFNRERNNPQTIKSKTDMLALTGPYRALVTLGNMYFEFDLKTKGKAHDEVQFSKGVISYYCIPDHKRIILQLPSFQSTVKLVLQHVALPVAASLQVSVVKTGPKDPPVHFDGKITAGTTRNYRQHMVLYDSSVHSGDLVRENGSLVLNRNLVSVYGYTKRPAFAKEEKLALYVCFLDASREIEDIDKKGPEYEDVNDKDNDEDNDNNKDKEEEEEDLKNVVALKCPQSEIVWEHGCLKLKVKVDWTAVLDRPQGTDFFQRSSCLPHGCSIDYRWGIRYE